MIVDFEERLKTRLQAVINAANLEAKVESYPDNPSGYTLSAGTPVVLVRYNGKRFQVPPNRQFISQTFSIEYDVFVLFRSIRGSDKGYELMQAITDGLIAYDLQPNLRLYQLDEELISEQSEEMGFWIYQQRWAADALHRAY